MKLNKTLAVALHRAMWTDMQTELGDNPTPNQRMEFKAKWVRDYFPNEYIMHNCFLCEYAFKGDTHSCSACPIRWPEGHCTGYDFSYCMAPISDILALPEKGKKCTDLPDDCKKYVAHDETAAVRAYYTYKEEQMDPYVKSSTLLRDTLNKYKDYLSDESGLDRNRPVGDHIHEIVKNSMEAGAADERDRIQEKIYEVLLS